MSSPRSSSDHLRRQKTSSRSPKSKTPRPVQCKPVHDYGPKQGSTVAEFLARLHQMVEGLQEEYQAVVSMDPDHTKNTVKAEKYNKYNRYKSQPMWEESRVRLSSVGKAASSTTDYINANFVDGYQHAKAYICCQGPTEDTTIHMWRMIWQQGCLVIVQLAKFFEKMRRKCYEYFPQEEGIRMKVGNFMISSKHVLTPEDNHTPCYITKLKVRLLKDDKTTTEFFDETRIVHHLLYAKWPDFGTPDPSGFQEFLTTVREQQETSLKESRHWQGCKHGPPIVVHCSAGLGRTGTFVAVDILLRKFEDSKLIDVRDVVHKIRLQRLGAVQDVKQYEFINLAVLQYCWQRGIIEQKDVDLNKFSIWEPRGAPTAKTSKEI